MPRRLLLLLILIPVVSCKKSGHHNDPAIVGVWTWTGIHSGAYFQSNPSASSVKKTITFEANGTAYIAQNDSFVGPDLEVIDTIVLLPKMITDTTTYQTGVAPIACAIGTDPLLTIGGADYQYFISGDSLYLSNGPCIASVEVTYVKVQ